MAISATITEYDGQTVDVTISEGVGPAGPDASVTNANVNTAIGTDPGASTAAMGIGVVNVLHEGAVGDGSTDDTAAIQTAINDGRAVYFPIPASHYKITAALSIPRNGLVMFADGFGQVKIKQVTAGENGIEMGGDFSYFRMEGLWIEGPGSATSTKTGVDLNGTSTFTLRHEMHRCFVSDFQTGLKTGDTVLFKASHIQIASNVTDIDLTATDTAEIDSWGTGTSFGGGATGNTGILCSDNHQVLLSNGDAGNAAKLLEVGSGCTVILDGGNYENLTADGAITVKSGGVLHMRGTPRILGDPTTTNSAFVLLDADSSGGSTAPTLMIDEVRPPANWRDVVSRGTYRYNSVINYTGRQTRYGTRVYFQSTGGGSIDTERLMSAGFPVWHSTYATGFPNNPATTNVQFLGTPFYLASRDDSAAVDEAAGMYLRNRFGTVDRADFNIGNHQRVVTNSSAAINSTVGTAIVPWTYSLPANTLLKAGERLRVVVVFGTAANANSKTLWVRLGGQNASDATALASNNVPCRLVVDIFRRAGATDWVASSTLTRDFGTPVVDALVGTANLATALNLEIVTTTTGSADIVIEHVDVEWRKGSINP